MPPGGHPHVFVPRARLAARGGRRPTIDSVIVGGAASESTNFDMDSINRSMLMNFHVMCHATEFRHRESRILSLKSPKATYLIPELALRDLGAYLDE
jgi:hypothetical protein